MTFLWNQPHKLFRKTNTRTSRHKFSSLIRVTEGNHTQTLHSSSQTRSVTLLNSATSLSLLQASANIEAFPSAIVLQKQKPEDHSFEKKKKTAAQHLSPSHTDSWTEHLTKAERRCLDSISCLDPLNYQAS